MWFKTSLLVVCLLLQSCSMTFMNMGDRKPASEEEGSTEENPVEKLFGKKLKAMNDFKGRIMGSEKDPTCTPEQLDADFKKLMASLKRDSCSVSNYTIDREEFNKRSCPKTKVKGYFDTVVAVTIAEEKAYKKDKKKTLTFFQNRVDDKFIAFYKEAQNYHREISAIVQNSSYPVQIRALMIAQYVDMVLLPMRDLVVIMRAYLPKESDGSIYFQSLQVNLPDEFVKGLDNSTKGIITMGLNPQGDPFYLELKPQDNGSTLLGFSETDVIRRDVLTLLKAPTAKNYVIALKWMTLHMMLSQEYLYQIVVGGKDDVTIPKSCQSHFNGNLPASMKFKYEEGVGEKFLESIIASHGLSSREDDHSYYDYYLQNVNRNPLKDGYSGLVPFENYKNALRSTEKAGPLALEPQFDDVAHFKSVLSFKLGQAQSIFKGRIKNQTVTYTGEDTFKKMLGQFSSSDVAEFKTSSNEKKQIFPGRQNLSPYLLEVMQAQGFTDYTQLITERMKKKFVGRKVKIDFPSMYSSPIWRDWSLKVLADLAYKHKDDPLHTPVFDLAKHACQLTTRKSGEMGKICQDRVNPLAMLSDFLAEFRTGDKYIPSKRLEEGKFQEVYPYMSFLWQQLRDTQHIIPEAEPYELNFLLDQMSAGNPWARLKFSYMVALDQIEYAEAGTRPEFVGKTTMAQGMKEYTCKMENLGVKYNNLVAAGKILGLDKTLNYNHAANVLNAKERNQVWKTIVDEIQKNSGQLFSVKEKNQTYYQLAENISYKTILTEEQALNTGVAITQKATKEIKSVTEQSSTELAQFFLQLYKLRDPQKQKKVFEDFTKANGIDNAFSVKLAFLSLDEAYKKPIYKSVLQMAAETRRLQIITQLDRFCKMDVNDETQFKNIFYSTTKAQNDINQAAGLPGVPEDVLDQINEMSASEWRDMWWGIGSGVAGMAALVIGGACTTLTGGICAPLGGVMAVAGLSALGIQVKLAGNELDRHDEADKNSKEIQIMEDLGFANGGSSEEVSRSYAWAAFEAISIAPLIGVAVRSALLGPKLAYIGTREALRQTGKLSFLAASKGAVAEEEVRMAASLLESTTIAKNLGVDEKSLEAIKVKVDKIGALYKKGEISSKEMFKMVGETLAPVKRAKLAMGKTVRGEIGKVTIKKSKDEIDNLVVKLISDYFADNPKEMLRFVQGYTGERLNQAIKIMDDIQLADKVGGIPVYSSMKNWLLTLRHVHLAKNATKLLRIEKELIAMGDNSSKLAPFLKKNIDDLSDIFIDIPMKKRELPYFVFVQGMPEFKFINGRKIPFFSSMAQGQTIKKFFIARSRLIEESYNAQARSTLKLKRYVQSHTTFDAFKSFQSAVVQEAMSRGGAEGAKFIQQYRKVEEALAKKLFAQFSGTNQYGYTTFKEMMIAQSKTVKVTKEKELELFKQAIFNPQTMKEKIYAQSIWESVPAKDLMNVPELSEFAHVAVQQLAKYEDINSFERYLSALKVLTVTRNSAVLDVM